MIALVSLSFKNTPQRIREYFAFGEIEKRALLRALQEEALIEEAAALITCNRTEIYVNIQNEKVLSTVISIILDKCEMITGRHIEHLRDYVLVYSDRRAVAHLYRVSAGLDSMVVGEDQILGQVKDAIEFARECGSAHLYLNTLFRDAVTEAKKIKTETLISKSGVSTATLALKTAKLALSGIAGKSLLLIGASGKIGNIVLKNALSYDFENIYATRRSHVIEVTPSADARISIIEYNDRYRYIDNADIIISATRGPHFTLTKEHIIKECRLVGEKVFIDLALPGDIDENIKDLPGVYYYNIEDMKDIARENNEKKKISIERAEVMVEEGVEKFLKWAVFQENMGLFSAAADRLLLEMARIGEKKAIEHLFYRIRDKGSMEALRALIEAFK